MKKLLIILLLPLLCQSLVGQSNSILQFELGIGMNNSGFFKADHAQAVNLNGTLKYQLKSVALALRYEQVFSTIGIEGPTEYYALTNGLRGSESEFSNYKSLQVRFDYCPNLEYFKPIFGVGIGKVFLDKEIQYYDDSARPIETPSYLDDPEKRDYYALVFHFGYKVKNIRYGITLLPARGKETESIFGTSLSYSFGLTKRKSVPKYELTLNQHWKSRPPFLRVEVGRSLLVPLENYYAASARYFVGAQIDVGNSLYLGASYEARGARMGFDKNTVHIQFVREIESFYVRKTDISTSISARKVSLHKFKSIGKNVEFYYGGGVGVYKIDRTGEVKRSYLYYPPEFQESSKWGVFVSTGFRTGWLSNKLELNLPLGKIPIYVGLQTAIGIQVRKPPPRKNGVIEMPN